MYFANYCDTGLLGFATIEGNYAGSVLIACDAYSWATIPHEIGHNLLNSITHTEGYLAKAFLMYGYGFHTDIEGIAQKRLTEINQKRIFR